MHQLHLNIFVFMPIINFFLTATDLVFEVVIYDKKRSGLDHDHHDHDYVIETRIFFSIEWYNFQVEIRMCIISYTYNSIQT